MVIRNIKLELSEESNLAKFVGDKNVMSETLSSMYKLLAVGNSEVLQSKTAISFNKIEIFALASPPGDEIVIILT